MKLPELVDLLESIGYPVTFSEFKVTPDNPPPNPPFIVYLIEGSNNFFADNITYRKITNVQIELYTVKKELAVEAKLESLLDQNELPYETTELLIKSEGLYQKTYEVGMI